VFGDFFPTLTVTTPNAQALQPALGHEKREKFVEKEKEDRVLKKQKGHEQEERRAREGFSNMKKTEEILRTG